MSWNYSGDPRTSAKDAVRLHIQDTNPDEPLIADEEILYFLDLEEDTLLAAAACAESIAARFAREAESVTIGDYSEKRGQAARYLALAKTLRQASDKMTLSTPFAGGISRTQKEQVRSDIDRVKPAFYRHMQEYPGLFDRGRCGGKYRV